MNGGDLISCHAEIASGACNHIRIVNIGLDRIRDDIDAYRCSDRGSTERDRYLTSQGFDQ